VIGWLVRCAALVAIMTLAGRAVASETLFDQRTLYPSPNERFGFGAIAPLSTYDVSELQAGWYLNWGVPVNPTHPGGMNVAYVVRLQPGAFSPSKATIGQVVRADPGALWFIGNEPECIFQDGLRPEEYAPLYYELYGFIKAHDPTARVAVGGVVEPTALRLRWLEAVWTLYQARYGRELPADLWNIHNFVLQEVPGDWGPDIPAGICAPWGALYSVSQHGSLAIFAEHVLAMRRWMAAHGQRDKPLVISEYGILFNEENGFSLAKTRAFMQGSFDYLLSATDPDLGLPADGDRLVQQWLWYSLDDDAFTGWGTYWANLLNPDTGALTPVGQAWSAYVKPLFLPYVDVAPLALRMEPVGATVAPGSSVIARGFVANLGNTPISQPFTATLFAETNGVRQDLAVRQIAGLPARHGGGVWIEGPWTIPDSDRWALRIEVDVAGQVSETNRTNNELAVVGSVNAHLSGLNVAPGPIVLVEPGTTASVTITAQVENWGTLDAPGAEIVFVADHGQPLGTSALATIGPRGSAAASVRWEGVPLGWHVVTATVRLAPDLNEVDSNDNVAQARFFVAASRLFLPSTPAGRACTDRYTCREMLANGGFEQGSLAGWSVIGIAPTILDFGCYHSDYCAYLGGFNSAQTGLRQRVTIPADATLATLSLAWGGVTAETRTTAQDHLTVELRELDGRLLRTLLAVDNRHAVRRWDANGFDLSDLAGRTVEIHIVATLDDSAPTQFFLDNISLQGCQFDPS